MQTNDSSNGGVPANNNDSVTLQIASTYAARGWYVFPVHASPDGISGSRCWVDARDFAAAWLWLTEHFDGDERATYYPTMPTGPLRYNIVGEEASNLDVAQRMAAAAGRSLDYELVDYHSQRPGHDHRYALDGSLLAELGWPGPRPLDDTLADIAAWYEANPKWLDA